MNRNRPRNCCFLALAAGLATVAAAGAQTQADNQPPEHPAPLGGPEVKQRQVPGVHGAFGAERDGRGRMAAERIPPRVMRGALGAIMDEEAPDEIRATDEQRDRIREIYRGFEDQVSEYLESHRAQLEELRSKIPAGAMAGPAGELFRRLDGERRGPEQRGRPRPEPEQGAGKARRAAEEIPVEVREQLRELAAGMPSFEQAYTKIWAELRPEQRRAVEERLEEFRERQARMREDMYVERRMNARDDDKRPPLPRGRGPAGGPRPEAAPDAPGKGPRAPGRGPASARRERLLELFERLTPQQQEQLLARLEGRRANQGPPPRGPAARPNAPRRGEDRPAPPGDDMPVPPPGEMGDRRP